MMNSRVPAAVVASCLLAAASMPVSADTFYATSSFNNVRLLTLDPDTGQVLTSLDVSGEEALFGGLTVADDGLYSIDGYNDGQSDRTFRINPETGEGTVVGDTGENWNFRSVETHPITGTLYATRDNVLYTIDRDSGAATRVANIVGSALDQTTAIAIRADGTAFIVDIGDTGLYSLDLQTGAATHLGNLRPGTREWFQDLAFDGFDRLWGILNGGGLYLIDVENVSNEFKFSTPFYRGIAFGELASRCSYTLKKVKAKRCDSCPAKGDEFATEEVCQSVGDCRKTVKTTIPCPEGNGTCKVKAKKRQCG